MRISTVVITLGVCSVFAVISGALLKIEANNWGNVILNIGLCMQFLLVAILVGKKLTQRSQKNA